MNRGWCIRDASNSRCSHSTTSFGASSLHPYKLPLTFGRRVPFATPAETSATSTQGQKVDEASLPPFSGAKRSSSSRVVSSETSSSRSKDQQPRRCKNDNLRRAGNAARPLSQRQKPSEPSPPPLPPRPSFPTFSSILAHLRRVILRVARATLPDIGKIAVRRIRTP